MNNDSSSLALLIGTHVLADRLPSDRHLQHLLALREARELARQSRPVLFDRLRAAIAGFREERLVDQRACQDCAAA
jgi:hypothetical protein